MPSPGGAWLAAVDVPWLGVEAMAELGVALERLVRVDSGDRQPARWAEALGAALDGFEVVITQPPGRVSDGVLRRVRARVQARGAVLVVVGDTAGSPDVTLCMSNPVWDRVARGHGHLRARRLLIEASGRRVPQTRRTVVWLPGPTGRLAAVVAAASSAGLPAAV